MRFSDFNAFLVILMHFNTSLVLPCRSLVRSRAPKFTFYVCFFMYCYVCLCIFSEINVFLVKLMHF